MDIAIARRGMEEIQTVLAEVFSLDSTIKHETAFAEDDFLSVDDHGLLIYPEDGVKDCIGGMRGFQQWGLYEGFEHPGDRDTPPDYDEIHRGSFDGVPTAVMGLMVIIARRELEGNINHYYEKQEHEEIKKYEEKLTNRANHRNVLSPEALRGAGAI